MKKEALFKSGRLVARAVGAVLLVSLVASGVWAAIPPAEKLFPANTLVLVAVPDCKAMNEAGERSPLGQLWRDPAMKPFRDKLMDKLEQRILRPLEQSLRIRFADYTNMFPGQIAFGLIQTDDTLKRGPAAVLVADARERSGQLKTNLADIRRKWTEAGHKVRTEKIRDTEFTVFLVPKDLVPRTLERVFKRGLEEFGIDLEENAEAESDSAGAQPVPIYVAQKDSALIVASESRPLESLLAAMAGGLTAALADDTSFRYCYNYHLKTAKAYVWLNTKAGMELMAKATAAEKKDEDESDFFPRPPGPDAIFGAMGLSGVRCISASYTESADGYGTEVVIYAPEGARKGFLKLVGTEKKDVLPPEFVPADVTGFWRCRVSGQKFWDTITGILSEITPFADPEMIINQINQSVRLNNPSFDFKRDVLGNLGDDFLGYQKPPRSSKPADLASPPQLFLIGSPRPAELVKTVNTLIQSGGLPLEIKEREVAGRKIYSLQPRETVVLDSRPLNYVAGANYVGLSTDPALLEEFVRQQKPAGALKDKPGLQEAFQKVQSGQTAVMLSYENQAALLRTLLGALKQNGGTVTNLVDLIPGLPVRESLKQKVAGWIDVTLLPSYDKIARYFHFTVTAIYSSPDAVVIKSFAPTPPGLKK